MPDGAPQTQNALIMVTKLSREQRVTLDVSAYGPGSASIQVMRHVLNSVRV